MSTRYSVRLVYGIDLGVLSEESWHRVDAAHRANGAIDHDCHAGYDVESRTIIFAAESPLDLMRSSVVPDEPVDVTAHIALCPEGEWVARLLAFCQRHSLPYRVPRWLAVAYVA